MMIAPEEVNYYFSILLSTQILEELSEDLLSWPSIYRGAEGEATVLVANQCLIGVYIASSRWSLFPRIERQDVKHSTQDSKFKFKPQSKLQILNSKFKSN